MYKIDGIGRRARKRAPQAMTKTQLRAMYKDVKAELKSRGLERGGVMLITDDQPDWTPGIFVAASGTCEAEQRADAAYMKQFNKAMAALRKRRPVIIAKVKD
jgi:hypothetical protein